MNTTELISRFRHNHQVAAAYICALEDTRFVERRNEKWSPAQQLSHLILCLIPISQALASPDYIRDKFGLLTRGQMDYDELIAFYKKGLRDGGKAPERFLPENIGIDRRESLQEELEKVLSLIEKQLGNYSEEELDTLVLPHPFLGALSIRELFYLMSYHPIHHLDQVRTQLEKATDLN